MRVGVSFLFNNAGDRITDQELYRENLRIVDLIEPLGFDSAWAVEHHFTNYTICPDTIQFLTWVAARTEAIQLGTQVVVLPWHDPLRVAEQVSLLDTLSRGRFLFGFGRGAARVEFQGFRVPMEESRQRFVESADMILAGLESGYCEYDGEFIKQPRVPIRPAPFKSFKGRTYCAAVSPETMEIAARLRAGVLINPQKPWEKISEELATYRGRYHALHGEPPPPPVSTTYPFVHPDPEYARETVQRYMVPYYAAVLEHYEFSGRHFEGIQGYEFYRKMSRVLRKAGDEGAAKFFIDLQPWGTPDQVIAKMLDVQKRVRYQHCNANFAFGHLPAAEAEQSMRLFAAEVLPVLKQVPAATPA